MPKEITRFNRYNIVVGISFILSYIACVLFIDILHFPAWIIVLVVSILAHFLRYPFLYEIDIWKRVGKIAGGRNGR